MVSRSLVSWSGSSILAYSPEVYRQKCGVVFQYVFKKFPDGNGH